MSRLIASMFLIALLSVACTYEKDVGASERSNVREYVEEAFEIEQQMTSKVGAAMEKEPIVWDETASAGATVNEVLAAYERYFAAALPHVSEAIRRWDSLQPTDTTELFHRSTLTAFRGYELMMESGIEVLTSGEMTRMDAMLTKMDATEDAMEIARQELGRLLEITD